MRQCVAALLLLLISALPQVSGAQTATEVDLSRLAGSPNPRLGLAFPGSDPANYGLIARAGIGVVRISAAWSRIEPTEGAFDFAALDHRIAALQELGLAPFVTFESNADWATDPQTRQVRNARPSDPRLWRSFIGRVVERYDGDGQDDMPGLRGGVRYWQAANEWISERNRSGGWAASTDELLAYLRDSHDAVKRADPSALFVLGGIAAFNLDILLVARTGLEMEVRQLWNTRSETVLTLAEMRGPRFAAIIRDRVLPVLTQAPYDIADAHLYGPEARDPARIEWLREVSGRPVLSSECGGPSLDYGGSYSEEAHFTAVLARNLGTLAAGAEFCLWFRLGEGDGATYGNARTALYSVDRAAKPGVFAYRLLSRLIGPDATVQRRGDTEFEIRQGGETSIAIGWGVAAQTIRADAAVRRQDMLCLARAETGLLSSRSEQCPSGAPTVSGQGLAALLSPF